MCRYTIRAALLVACSITTAHARGSTEPNADEAPPKASPTVAQQEVICARDDRAPRVDDLRPHLLGESRFTMHLDGRFELSNRAADDTSVRFLDVPPGGGVARIDVRNADTTVATYCGAVADGTEIDIPAVDGQVVVIQLYAQVTAPGIADERKQVLSTAERVERRAVHALANVAALVATANAAHDPRPDATALSELESHAAHDSLLTLRTLAAHWKCPAGTPDQPMSAAICDEVAQLSSTISELAAIAHRTAAHLGQLDTDAELFKAYYETFPTLVAKLDPGELGDEDAQCATLAKLRWLDDKTMFRLASRATLPVVPAARLAFVKFGETPPQRTGADLTKAWGLVMSGMPTGTKPSFASHAGKPLSIDPTVVIGLMRDSAFGMLSPLASTAMKLQWQQLSEGQRATAQKNIDLIRSLDTDSLVCGREASQSSKRIDEIERVLEELGTRKTQTPRESLEPYFKKLDRAESSEWTEMLNDSSAELPGRPAKKAVDVEKLKKLLESKVTVQWGDWTALTHELVDKPLTPADVERLAKDRVVPRAKFSVDTSLLPAAKIETAGQLFIGLDKTHVEDLVACAGDPCTGADDDKNVKARASLVPDRTGSWTMLVEATLGIGLLSRYTHWSDPSWHSVFSERFDIESAPAFDPVGRGDGPDQIYQLESHSDPRNAVSTGLVVGCYVKDRWLVGAGPALLVGTSGAAFTQWDARAAYRLGDRGVFITFGPSLRFLPVPADYRLGDTVSVAKSAMGTASAPTDRTYYTAELQFDVGVAIDIGTLGAAAADTIKAVGGKK